MDSTTRRHGDAGERIAAVFLESRGYVILARGFRSGRHEIDLVASRGVMLVLVEVKWRRHDPRFGGTAAAWRPAQRRNAAAAAWAAASTFGGGREQALRFDLITIDETPRGLVLEHRRGAWSPGGGPG